MAKRSRIKRRGKYKKTQKPDSATGVESIPEPLAAAPDAVGTSQSNGTAPAPTGGAELGASEFEKIVAQSQAAVKENQSKPRSAARRRGRPRKSESAVSPKVEGAAPMAQAPIHAPEPAPDISQIVKMPLIALSKIPAHKHKIPELALSSDEAEACANALNTILQAFVPDQNAMNPKTAAIVTGALVFGSIGFTKLSIYSSEMQKRAPAPVPEVQTEIAEAQKTDGVRPEDYFRRETPPPLF